MDVSQYLDVFIDETKEHLQNLSDCIMTLEREPENMDTINEIFRAAHSLKGMAGTMGFKRMQHLTHDMENVFQEIRSGNKNVTSGLVDILFRCLDALDVYLENIQNTSDEGTDDNASIIKELNDILNENEEGGEEAAAPEAPQEAAKETAAPKTVQDHLKRLTEKDKETIREAMDKGLHVYCITAFVNEDCLLKAARAFLVFKAAEEFGTILAQTPSPQEIEDENFELDFTFYLGSKEAEESIVAAARGVSEISEVLCKEILADDLNGKQEAEPEPEPESVQQPAPTNAIVESPAPEKPEKTAPSAKKQSGSKQSSNKPVTSRTVRVDIEKLDAVMNQVSELIIAKNSLVSISTTEGDSMGNQAFHDQIESLERITTDLHESVMKVRMVPIESVVNKFPRMIRDLSKKLDKKMELYMTGEDTELDRTVVDQIGDPLQHLLRNSADHGLESAEIRKERGKPEIGMIRLNAFQEGNNVIIEVSDDGGGIDTEAVKNKAIERGVISKEQSETMSQKEIIDLLFMPSFSMAKKITDVSGRGVGLDVVKSNIEALGGDVEVATTLGEGSKFTVRLPLTLAIIQALMVEIRDGKYAIALGSIQKIESISVNEIKYVQAEEVINIRGQVIPLIRVDNILDLEPKEEEEENLTVVIVKKGEKSAGLVVDNLIGQQEIVIKSLGKYIENNKIISGATILGDGEVALILDVNTLL